MRSKIVIMKPTASGVGLIGVDSLLDVYDNTVAGDLVTVYPGTYDMGTDNLKLKPGVTLQRVGNPTITSDNATGTIVAVDSNGDIETGIGTASITGKGRIINTTDPFKRIVGNVNYTEIINIEILHDLAESYTVNVLRNDIGGNVVYSEAALASLTFEANLTHPTLSVYSTHSSAESTLYVECASNSIKFDKESLGNHSIVCRIDHNILLQHYEEVEP